MKLIHSLSCLALTAVISLSSCGRKESAASFTGHINPADSIQELYFSFAPDGDIMSAVSLGIQPDSTGTFTFPDSILPSEGMFVNILADQGYFGMYLEPDKNATATIRRDKNGQLAIEFGGDNADINTYYNAYTGAFDSMKYFSPDEDEALPIEKYMENLEKANSELLATLPSVKDEAKRDKLAHMTERMYTWTRLRLLMDKAYEENKNVKDYPEYVSLVETIDPNEDVSLDCNLIFPWLNSNLPADSFSVEHTVAQLKFINDNITNPRTRKVMFNQIPYQLYAYGNITPEQGQAFIEAYSTIAKEYPELIDKYTLRTQGLTDIKVGDKVPYDPTLISPEGKKIKLSSLYGTPLYIDIWATWCGPCCKEIPHLENLVEKMKDFKGVRFVSISTDENTEAWKNKLTKDNPTWEQYIFSPDDGNRFMQACGINGIPRFMIIGADGCFISPDAERPSAPEIESMLRALAD